jgi:Sigma-70, region 4
MTPLDLLAPDQRAVLELILRQDRSYGELSEMLGISERAVRERAEAALRALAGAPEDDVDTGRITDWLLDQQTERAAGATRALLRTSEPARAWAELAAGRLREVGGERLPGVPARDDEAAERPRPRPRPVRDATPATADPAPRPAPAGVRSSRLGGAILIGVAALAVAAFLVWFLSRDDDSNPAPAKAQAAATATATATAPAAGSLPSTGNDVVLQGTNGSNAAGLMRLFKASGGAVQFAIGAQGLPNNKKGEFYAVWFTKKDGSARLLGFPQTQVTNGTLTVGGPGKADTKAFPRWFATYDNVLITRETTAQPKKPGPVVLTGTLPHGQG